VVTTRTRVLDLDSSLAQHSVFLSISLPTDSPVKFFPGCGVTPAFFPFQQPVEPGPVLGSPSGNLFFPEPFRRFCRLRAFFEASPQWPPPLHCRLPHRANCELLLVPYISAVRFSDRVFASIRFHLLCSFPRGPDRTLSPFQMRPVVVRDVCQDVSPTAGPRPSPGHTISAQRASDGSRSSL